MHFSTDSNFGKVFQQRRKWFSEKLDWLIELGLELGNSVYPVRFLVHHLAHSDQQFVMGVWTTQSRP